MTSIYDYKNNIKVTTAPNGDVVITMTKKIHTVLMNNIFDAHLDQERRDLGATAKDTLELWEALEVKDKEDK